MKLTRLINGKQQERSMLSKNREKYLLQKYFNTKNPKNLPSHLKQFGSRASDTTDDELFFITQYTSSIDRLALGDSFVTETGLQLLGKLKRVLYLDLSGVPLNDENVDCILHFKELEYLYIKHTNITAKGIYRILRSCPALETLIADIAASEKHLLSDWEKEFPGCQLEISFKGA